MKRVIEVVGAVIRRDEKILIVRRAAWDSGGGSWEFPGGKIDPGESPEEALHREIQEELGIRIQVQHDLGRRLHSYESLHVYLHLFLCQTDEQDLTLTEHDAFEWLSIEDLVEERLLEADRPFVGRIRRILLEPSVSPLSDWGWRAETFPNIPRELLGRVLGQDMTGVRVVTEAGEKAALVPGRLRKQVAREEQITVGDWVVFRSASEEPLVIEEKFPRKSVLVRKSPRGDHQALAANVDLVLITSSLNEDYSLNRMERYISMAYSTGAAPAVLLTKADLHPEAERVLAETKTRFPDVPVVALSTNTHQGFGELWDLLVPGRTAALVGSSGVGKSTLLNHLAGRNLSATSAIRDEDGKGRHTTVARSLSLLPGGALLIDNPGLREIQLADAEEGVETLFADVAVIVLQCRFSNCTHQKEPQCAVREALSEGTLDSERWESYQRLLKESTEASRSKKQHEAVQSRKKFQKKKT